MSSLHDLFRWLTRRRDAAPAAPRSLVYALCQEYRQFDLWAAYHAFRLDPRARTWRRLRRRSVPWQAQRTVEGVLQRLCAWNGKRTPDPGTVGLALVTAPSVARQPRRR